jgi:alpha-1,3-mannosyltransferase
MSAGLIPIANNIPSFNAILDSANVGLVTDFDASQAAGKKISEFIEASADHYSKLRAKAIAAAERYDWTTVERTYHDEYERIVGEKTRTLLGVEISVKSRDDVVDLLDQAVSQHRPLRVSFANAHMLRLAAKSSSLRKVLKNFLVLNDGIGVDIASRMKFGKRFPDNLNGTDFVPYYLAQTRHRLRIFLVGARPEVVRVAAERFAESYPSHSIVGVRDGYFSREKDAKFVCDDIRSSQADLLLVAFGNPNQEVWIDEYSRDFQVPLQLGVGALFDFTSGRVWRAPAWVRRIRCEWMYRLAQEPKRLFYRYIVGNIVFLRLAMLDRRSGFSP